MDVVALLTELRAFATDLRLTKWELFGLFVVSLVAMRLPTILLHRREMAAIRLEHNGKAEALQKKIEEQREKRERKALRGKKS